MPTEPHPIDDPPNARRLFDPKRRDVALKLGGVVAAVLAWVTVVSSNLPGATGGDLVNVSYDPTREVYQALNPVFGADYARKTGAHVHIVQSHGGSSRQARKVIARQQPADVVTLGLYSDIEALQKEGFVAPGWSERLPHHANPYTSTILFVVRAGNPLHVQDWPDLLAPGLDIVTADPRTSGNGKLAALAAWASVRTRNGTDEQATRFLRDLYRHVDTLYDAARTATNAFAEQNIGDVHLTWESEAIREVAASKGRLAIVYPPVSILAEPYVAWVDKSVSGTGKAKVAQAYLAFLFSPQAQDIFARFGYRPSDQGAAARAGVHFPDIKLIPVTAIARDWSDAYQRFFSAGGLFDAVIRSKAEWASR